jgi:hypothetical protein
MKRRSVDLSVCGAAIALIAAAYLLRLWLLLWSDGRRGRRAQEEIGADTPLSVLSAHDPSGHPRRMKMGQTQTFRQLAS